jgi:hypothetical protein
VLRQTSDARLKADVQPLGDVLQKLGAIRGVSYQRLDAHGAAPSPREIGVIAQDVEQAFPELVAGGDDHFMTVDYSGLTSVLLEAIKALQARIDVLEGRLQPA